MITFAGMQTFGTSGGAEAIVLGRSNRSLPSLLHTQPAVGERIRRLQTS
jgi:hypothetical protein